MALEGRAAAGMHRAIPALPVRSVEAAAAHYRDAYGFTVLYEDESFAKVGRDNAALHLWGATDESWRTRPDHAQRPITSGAESFLAGTSSCRIEVADVDTLFAELQARNVLHPVSADGVTHTDLGTREFATLDLDGNLIEFVQWMTAESQERTA